MLGDDLVAALEPWLTPDLEDYVTNVAGMFSEVEEYAAPVVGEDEDLDGWTLLLDPARCPADALPYLAQFVGERLPVGIAEAAGRAWIVDSPNQSRGSLLPVVYATQRSLTGGRAVTVVERDPDFNGITIITYASMTPYPSKVREDILSMLPAGLVLNYQIFDGQNWSSVDFTFAGWDAVDVAYADWSEMFSDAPTYQTFIRPL